MCTPHCFEILPGSGAHSEDGCQEGPSSLKFAHQLFGGERKFNSFIKNYADNERFLTRNLLLTLFGLRARARWRTVVTRSGGFVSLFILSRHSASETLFPVWTGSNLYRSRVEHSGGGNFLDAPTKFPKLIPSTGEDFNPLPRFQEARPV